MTILQENADAIREMITQGKSKIEIARLYGVSKTTFYNFLEFALK
jgi:DNA invertase Pin-like site-specific DNA recombinase